MDNRIYQFKHFSNFPQIKHAVTMKSKDSSELQFSMNLRPSVQLAIQNRKKICKILGIDFHNLVRCSQVHKKNIAVISQKNKNNDYEGVPDTDGMITARKDIALMVLSADCPLIGLFDPVEKVIGAVHAGWRGTVLQIVMNAVRTMQENFCSEPENIHAVISTSIGPCCYQVGQEVLDEVSKYTWSKDCMHKKDKHDYFDLWTANINQLTKTGIPLSKIESAKICTHCHSKTFFSYRKGDKEGRFAFIIAQND